MNGMILVLAEETATTPHDSQSPWIVVIPFVILALVILGSYLLSRKNKGKLTPFQERQQQLNQRLERSEAYQIRSLALLERIAASLEKLENKP